MNTNFVRCKIALVLYILACITLIVSGCNKESEPTAPQNQNPFIGTWRLVKFDNIAQSGNIIWIFGESTVTIHAEGQTLFVSYSFDQTKNPKTMDLQVQGMAPNPNLAIYDFPSNSSLIIKLMDGTPMRATNFNVESGYDLEEFAKQ